MPRFMGDSVANTTTSTSSPFTLSASTITGHRPIQTSGVQINDTVVYRIAAVDSSGSETGTWEVGLGTYTTDTLTRTTFIASSTGSAVTFAAGTKNVYVTASGIDLVDRVRWFDGTPSNSVGFDGDLGVRIDGAMAGALYRKVGGSWAALSGNTTTWAGRPSASANQGGIITVSDLGSQDFYSDGTNWIPVGKVLQFNRITAENSSRTTGNGAAQTMATDTFPAGLILPGCSLRFHFAVDFLGTGASTKNLIVDDSVIGTFWFNRNAIPADAKSYAGLFDMFVSDTSASVIWAVPNQTNNPNNVTANTAGSTANLTRTATLNVSNAWNMRYRMIAASDEAWQLVHRSVVISYK